MKLLFITLLLALSEFSFAIVSEHNVNPGINQHYIGSTYQEWVEVFERDEREVYNQRHAVVKALKLRPASDVADIGAGTGFYSLLFAKAVGATGNVFAVDITEDFILNINRRAQEQNLKNIHAILSSEMIPYWLHTLSTWLLSVQRTITSNTRKLCLTQFAVHCGQAENSLLSTFVNRQG